MRYLNVVFNFLFFSQGDGNPDVVIQDFFPAVAGTLMDESWDLGTNFPHSNLLIKLNI